MEVNFLLKTGARCERKKLPRQRRKSWAFSTTMSLHKTGKSALLETAASSQYCLADVMATSNTTWWTRTDRNVYNGFKWLFLKHRKNPILTPWSHRGVNKAILETPCTQIKEWEVNSLWNKILKVETWFLLVLKVKHWPKYSCRKKTIGSTEKLLEWKPENYIKWCMLFMWYDEPGRR